MPTFTDSLYNLLLNRSGVNPNDTQYNQYPGQTKNTQYPLSTEGYPSESILGAGSTHDISLGGTPEQGNASASADMAAQQADVARRDAKAQMTVWEQKAREATDGTSQKVAELKLAEAQLQYKTAELAYAKATDPSQNPVALAKLENQLAIERDELKNRFDSAQQDQRLSAELSRTQYEQDQINQRTRAELESREREGSLDREGQIKLENMRLSGTHEENELNRAATSQENQLGRDFTAEQNRMNREAELSRTKLQAGVQLRGQEIDRLHAMDEFTTNTVANQIRKGELDVDRGYKVFQSALAARRLPSEITANIGQALAPFIPNLSAYKAGEIPIGFESGGPMEIAMRQGGAQTYDPSVYAEKPVGVDLFGIAKKMGATPPKGSLPDPNKIIPQVSGINTNPTSALANLPASMTLSPDELNGITESLKQMAGQA